MLIIHMNNFSNENNIIQNNKKKISEKAWFYISANLLNDLAKESKHLKSSVFSLFPCFG